MQAKIFPRIYRAVFLTALVLVGTGFTQTPSSSSEGPAAARVRALNNSLLALHGRMQAEGPNDSALLHSQAAPVIAQRAAALAALMQQDAHTALTFAFSPELAADLATKFPQSSSQIESHVTLSGPVQHWIADYPGLKGSRSIWQMNAGGRSLTLYFAGQEPSAPKGRQSLQVTGVLLGSQMAVESSTVVESSAMLSGPETRVASAAHLGRLWLAFGMFVLGFAFVFPANIKREQMVSVLRHLAIYAVIGAFVFASTSGFAQNSCTTTGPQNTAVLLVNLPGNPLPAKVTASSVQDIFFASNTPGVSLNGFLGEASYGQASASGVVLGPYNLTGTYSGCSSLGSVLTDAFSAATAAGANLNDYSRIFLVFPDLGCGWAGLTGSGCSFTLLNGNTYNATLSYTDALYLGTRTEGVQLVSHEFGHNLGLLHSGTLTPATASDVVGPISSPGTTVDQGNQSWSTMGMWDLGLYTAPQKTEIMGWLAPTTNYQTVTASGTYTLNPLESNPPGLAALKVQRGTTNPGYYLWIEYRQPLGNYDSMFYWSQPYGGAMINYEDPDLPGGTAHSYLLNFTPSDTTGDSPALTAGQSWKDPYSNLAISVLSATPTGLTVNVNYGASPCTPANPTVSLTPLNPSVYPGTSAAYGMTITDNDSAACSSSSMTLASTQPSGWLTSFSSSSVTLNPGQSVSATMYKTGLSGSAPGTYQVNASALNNSYTGTGTANITLVSAPSLAASVAVSGNNFTPPTSIPITATVLNGGVPVSGAGVTFVLTNPNGNTSTQSATTGSSGTATWNYKVNSKSAAGLYTVSVQASVSSGSRKSLTVQTATGSSTTFSLQ